MIRLLLFVLAATGTALADQTADSLIVEPKDVPAETAPQPTPAAKPTPTPPPVPTMDRSVNDIVQSLSIEQRVAQLMLVSMEGLYGPNKDDRSMMRLFVPGGIIIQSIPQPGDAADYVAALRKSPVESQTGIPLLIGADVYRLTQVRAGTTNTFVPMPSMLAVAAAGDVPATERLAKLMSEHLSTMGFNMSFGPLLELAPTLSDAPGSLNNLGSSPAFAAQAGSTIVATMLANGIAPMPAGFPGGGADRKPKGPATLLTPRARLADTDLLPYKAAIEQGAPFLHVGNTLVPTIDEQSRPASLSSAVINDLLRTEVGYKGVIVAGPLDADDIYSLYPPGQAAVMALNAGADMLYWAEAGERINKAYLSLIEAVYKGIITESTLNAAVGRILEYKKQADLAARPLPITKKAAALANKSQYPREALEIERRSITLVQNKGNVLPLTEEASMPIGVTGVTGVEELKEALEEDIKPIYEQIIQTAKYIGEIEDFEVARLASASARTMICVFTDTRKTQGQTRLIQELKAHGSKVVVVLLGYPRNLLALQEADAILLAYSDGSHFGESIKAIADALLGKASIRMTPTTEDLRVQVGKSQTFDIQKVVHCPAGRLPLTIAEPYVAGLSVGYTPSKVVKSVLWDFGDGGHSKENRAEHAYKEAGRYTLSLTVKDIDNVESNAVFSIVAE